MYKILDFNLFNLESNLITNLDSHKNIGNTESLIKISDNALKNFNNRRVTHETIQDIYNILEYYMIDNSYEFLINYSIPCLEEYKVEQVELPIFMKQGIKLKIFNLNVIK